MFFNLTCLNKNENKAQRLRIKGSYMPNLQYFAKTMKNFIKRERKNEIKVVFIYSRSLKIFREVPILFLFLDCSKISQHDKKKPFGH